MLYIADRNPHSVKPFCAEEHKHDTYTFDRSNKLFFESNSSIASHHQKNISLYNSTPMPMPMPMSMPTAQMLQNTTNATFLCPNSFQNMHQSHILQSNRRRKETTNHRLPSDTRSRRHARLVLQIADRIPARVRRAKDHPARTHASRRRSARIQA